MRVSLLFLVILVWNYGLAQELTPIEEATPTYFPLSEEEVMVGEDVPSAKPVSYTHLTLPTNREV